MADLPDFIPVTCGKGADEETGVFPKKQNGELASAKNR